MPFATFTLAPVASAARTGPAPATPPTASPTEASTATDALVSARIMVSLPAFQNDTAQCQGGGEIESPVEFPRREE
ncbi:hypothetical protein JCM9957A_66150 [Kineosporia succinea]